MLNLDLPAFFALVARVVGGDVAAWQSIAVIATVTILLLLVVCVMLIARLSRYEVAPFTRPRYSRVTPSSGWPL